MIFYTPKTTEKDGKEEPQIDLSLYEEIEGKKFYYGETIPEGCEEVKNFNGKEETFLRVFKDRAVFDVTREFRENVKTILDAYVPQEELLSWSVQLEEARRFKKEPVLAGEKLKENCPMLCAIAQARYGKDVNALLLEGAFEKLCEKVLQKAALYNQTAGNLIGQKQRIVDSIEASQSMAELSENLSKKMHR